MTRDAFFDIVRRMRLKQREYAAKKTPALRAEQLDLERRCDDAIERLIEQWDAALPRLFDTDELEGE